MADMADMDLTREKLHSREREPNLPIATNIADISCLLLKIQLGFVFWFSNVQHHLTRSALSGHSSRVLALGNSETCPDSTDAPLTGSQSFKEKRGCSGSWLFLPSSLEQNY